MRGRNEHKPTEGERLGGTLAEGRLPSNGNQRPPGGAAAPVPDAREDRSGTVGSQPDALAAGYMKGLAELHFTHRVWLNALRFYREELYIFNGHLEQFVMTAAVPEAMPRVEQFQNKFLRQSDVIDQLGHDIKAHDQALAAQLASTSSGFYYRPFGVHNELRQRYEIFERLYKELKEDFRNWLAYNR
jgi:hypothetical protein